MDEFTGIAIWILMMFLVINIGVGFINSSTDFNSHGLSLGFTKPQQFTDANITAVQASTEVNCSTASANPLDFIPCEIGKITSPFNSLVAGVWTFATSWVDLFEAIFSPFGTTDGTPGKLFVDILIPILGLIQIVCIVVLLMRLGGIIRGGS